MTEKEDELYGSEDLPFSFNVMKLAAESSLWKRVPWRSHSGPDVRPIFSRDIQETNPADSSMSDCSNNLSLPGDQESTETDEHSKFINSHLLKQNIYKVFLLLSCV